MTEKTLNVLQQARHAMDLSLEEVANEIGSNAPSVSRIERAKQLPNRTLARAIYELYGRIIRLSEIYDPAYGNKQLDDRRQRKLHRLAKARRSGSGESGATG